MYMSFNVALIQLMLLTFHSRCLLHAKVRGGGCYCNVMRHNWKSIHGLLWDLSDHQYVPAAMKYINKHIHPYHTTADADPTMIVCKCLQFTTATTEEKQTNKSQCKKNKKTRMDGWMNGWTVQLMGYWKMVCLLWLGFFGTGTNCVCCDHVYVHRSREGISTTYSGIRLHSEQQQQLVNTCLYRHDPSMK